MTESCNLPEGGRDVAELIVCENGRAYRIESDDDEVTVDLVAAEEDERG